MDLGFNNNRAKLFDSSEICNNSQTFTANFFMINLNHEIYKDIDQLCLGASMFLVAHENFLVIEEQIAETTQDRSDKLLNIMVFYTGFLKI